MTRDEIKPQLRSYICRELIRNPNYPLEDETPLITGGLMDSFSLAYLGVFIESTFGVYIPDNELTVENMDTLSRITNRVLRG